MKSLSKIVSIKNTDEATPGTKLLENKIRPLIDAEILYDAMSWADDNDILYLEIMDEMDRIFENG